MTTIPRLHDHTVAVIDALTAAGLPVGEGQAPPNTAPPYVVVRPYPGPALDGPVSDRYADAYPNVLVTSVGETQASAEIVADRVRAAVLGDALVVPNRTVTQVTAETPQPAQHDDDVSPPLWYSTDIYGVWTTPTT